MAYRPHTRRLVVSDPGRASVVPLRELRAHLRIGDRETEFNEQLDGLERAAVAAIERETQRLLVPRQVRLFLPGLPEGRGAVELPGGRVAEVASVTVDGAAVTAFAVTGESPAVLVPDAEWPVVTGEGYPVEIVYTAGYARVPAALAVAVKMMAEDMFERPDMSASAGMGASALRARQLAAAYRIRPA